MKRLKVLYVADDFTGASDTLATLSRAGLRTLLYPGVPDMERHTDFGGLDALGVATGLRGVDPEEGRRTMLELAAQLKPIDAEFVHFKVCSTFDSAPETGNIPEIVDVLARERGSDWVAVLGGQPSLGRYCVFGSLFAAAADGAIHRIDRHPVMKAHPATPMREADLRRHLEKQGWSDIGLIDFRSYVQDAEQLADHILERIANGETRTLFDVTAQSDISIIGRALHLVANRKNVLCVGASSVAEALTSSSQSPIAAAPKQVISFDGPVFALAGSRSPVTAAQVDSAREYDIRTVDPVELANEQELKGVAVRCASALPQGRNVLLVVSSAPSPMTGRELAKAIARLAAAVLSLARPGCFAIAGGDTSSETISALGIESMSFIADIDPGVPLVALHGKRLDGLPVVLKGGQMGRPSLFDDLAHFSIWRTARGA